MTLVKLGNTNKEKERASGPWLSDVLETIFNEPFFPDRMVRVPPVNISETDERYTIDLAAPGLKKEDFKINLDKGGLSISAETKTEQKEETKRYNKREYSYATFIRSFTLPEGADQSNIEAVYNDGVLTVHIGKKEEAKSFAREIAVK